MAKSYKDNVLEALTQKAKGKDFSLSQNRPGFLSGMESAMKEPGDLEQWSVGKLREHPENSLYFQPLTGEAFDRLKKDIEENGMHDALIVTEENADGVRTVLSGHNRLNVARALGKETVPVRVLRFPRPEYETRFMIRDNLLRRQLNPEQVKALIVKLYGAELEKDGRGGDRGNQHTGGKVAKVHGELLAKRISTDIGITEGTAKRHLAAIRNPEGKTAQNRGKKPSHASQEGPGRTQKGGVGERVGGKKDAGAELLIMTADFLKAARALRGLKKADVDRAVDKIKTLYNICE